MDPPICDYCGEKLRDAETFGPGHYVMCDCPGMLEALAQPMKCYDPETGEEIKWRSTGGHGFSVGRDGIVRRWTEDEDGNREEWTEELCDSPVRDVFGGWLWDLALDPRGPSNP